ncbi:MAG TPA: hypothetical protein VF765_18335 [Polyangiaceae bacterium]
MSHPFEPETSEISSFTPRDERWFAAATRQARPTDSRPPTRPGATIGDPLADRWFR